MRSLAIIPLLALPTSTVLGQIEPTAEADPAYHVEIIIYALNDGNRAEEDFLHGQADRLPEPEPRLYHLPTIELERVGRLGRDDGVGGLETTPDPDRLADAATDPVAGRAGGDGLELIELRPDPGATGAAADSGAPDGFDLLAPDELTLNDVRASMDRLRAYTVLGHAGWVQAGVDTDRSVPVDLKRLGITNPAGTIEVYLRRFLHAEIDFEFFDRSGTRWSGAAGSGLMPLRYAESYRLHEERNAIRSGEIHYIDHPLYGVLIQITPAPDPEAETGASARPAG